MPYTLYLPSGKIMQFYLKSVAESYQAIYGGYLQTPPAPQTLFSNSI